MAWLIQDKNGNWIVRWNEGGRRRQKNTGTRNKSKANRYKRQIEENLQDAKFGISDQRPIPISELLKRRQEYLQTNNKSPHTIERERNAFKAFARFLAEDPLGTPSLKHFEDFKRSRREAGMTITTVNGDLKHLQAMFNWGAQHGYCQPIKIQKIDARKSNNLPPYLSEQDVSAFFKAIDTIKPPIPKFHEHHDEDYWRRYWRMVFLLYFETGGRKEEVANLRWSDVEDGMIRFRAANTKNSTDRYVPLCDPELIGLLEQFRGSSADRIIQHSGDRVRTVFKNYALAAGIKDPEKLKLHTVRHTCASHMVKAGVPLPAVMEILGHSNIEMTMIYIHLSPKDHRRAICALPWVAKKVSS